MSSNMTRRSLTRLLAGGALCGVAPGDTEGGFYALTASLHPEGDLLFPSVLFRIDLREGKVVWASNLFTADRGVHFVLHSFERRLLVLAGPQYFPNDIVVLRFDSPGSPRKVSIELEAMVVVGRHLVSMSGDLHLAIRLFRNGQYRFIALRLDDLEVREALPGDLYREFAIDGFVGGCISNNDFAFHYQPAGSRRLVVAETPPPRLPSWVVLPDGLSFRPDQPIGLHVANNEVLVFRPGRASLPKGPAGTTPFHVLIRRTGEWRSFVAPGGTSLARGFGAWVAVQVRELREKDELSPGADQRRNKLSPTGAPYDLIITGFRLYQPGVVYLYHAPSQRWIVEETGQGDTEVLWVKDEKVLFRCDRTLYEARIDGTRLSDKRKLIERDFIADVHWVFYGPPSPPPPDPPWRAFQVE